MALPGFSVAGLSLGRLVVASLALAAAAPLFSVRRPARRDLVRITGCGLSGMTAYQLLLNAGERTVPAGTASLLVSTAPIFAALLAFALLGERLTSRAWSGIAVGFLGAIVMTLALGRSLRLDPDALLVVAAAVAQATFFVLQKPPSPTPSTSSPSSPSPSAGRSSPRQCTPPWLASQSAAAEGSAGGQRCRPRWRGHRPRTWWEGGRDLPER